MKRRIHYYYHNHQQQQTNMVKTYKIIPTYKKSVCEVELYRKTSDINSYNNDDEIENNTIIGNTNNNYDVSNRYNTWNGPILRKETWWRYAEFLIHIPETTNEINDFLLEKGYSTKQEYLEYHGYDHEHDTIENVLLPDVDNDEHIFESDIECEYCWDGQGMDFRIELTRSSQDLYTQEECQAMEAEALRLYSDEGLYEEGLESLGWEHFDTIYEIYCKVEITLEETEEEKLKRQFEEFKLKFSRDLIRSPSTLGHLFDEAGYGDLSTFDDASLKFGEYDTFHVVIGLIPLELNYFPIDVEDNEEDGVQHQVEGDLLPSFIVAASCENCKLSFIYYLLRENVSMIPK